MKNTAHAYAFLEKLAGKWNTTGRMKSDDDGTDIEIKGTDTYEWLPGNYFLLHTADVMIGHERNQTTEIIGFDEKENHYTLQYYDNKGNSGHMKAHADQDNWLISGHELRFTGKFNSAGNVLTGIWEQWINGYWTHLMDIKLVRDV